MGSEGDQEPQVRGPGSAAEPVESVQVSQPPSDDPATRGNLEPPTPRRPLLPNLWNVASVALWAVTALAVTLLALRFGMRLVGVRDDITLPGMVYAVTGPLVSPFYRVFPAPERFDHYAVEYASLVAAGAVLGAALFIYIATLLLVNRRPRRHRIGHGSPNTQLSPDHPYQSGTPNPQGRRVP